MELNLSNRGLFSFDAAQARQSLVKATQQPSRSTGASSTSSESAQTLAATAPLIRLLNLSYNSLHIFTGGEALRGLAVLDLSHNELAQLRGQSLPSTLVKMNLSHNRLAQLSQLVDFTPRLQELDVGHNQLSASALRGLPLALTQLNAESNFINSLAPFTTLVHLVKLNVAGNEVEGGSDTLRQLQPLLSLRSLDLRGNPISDVAEPSGRDGNSSLGSGTEAAARREKHQGLLTALNTIVPRLALLNGAALSQAPENRMLKNGRRGAERQQEVSESRRHDATGEKSYASSSRDTSATRPALEVRLMQAKVSELRRLLLAAQDAESKARQERSLLTENVKSTALVIDQQGGELERLQEEMARLREEEQQLRVPMAAAEESFEQVHASLLASKAKAGAASLKK